MEEHDRTSWYYRGKRAAICALLKRADVHPTRIIDIGCGTGRNASSFDPTGHAEYVGIEPAEMAFETPGIGRSRVLRTSVADTSLEDTGGQADLVAMIDVLEHLDEDATLEDAKRFMSPSGQLLITVPAYRILWGKSDEESGHLRRYTLKTLKQAAHRHGLAIETWNHYFAFGFLSLLVISWMQRKGFGGRDGGGYFGPMPENRLLGWMAEAEGRAGRFVRFPFGSGIVCLLRFSEDFRP
jgi:SAM-dependent methyltransferase